MKTTRWQYMSFLALLSLTKTNQPTKNYSRTQHHGENPRTQGEAEVTPMHCSDQEERKVREVATCWWHCPFPRPAQSHTRGSSEKKEPMWKGITSPCSIVGHFVEVPNLISTLGIIGESSGFNHWESMMQKGEGLAIINTWILADQVHTP